MVIESSPDRSRWSEGAKRIVRAAGVRYEALQPVFGVKSPSAVGHYLNGRRQPSPEQLKRLADYLSVSMDEFFAPGAPGGALDRLKRLSAQGADAKPLGHRYDWSNPGQMDDDAMCLKVLRRAVFADVLTLSKQRGFERILQFANHHADLKDNCRLQRILANIRTGIDRAQCHAA